MPNIDVVLLPSDLRPDQLTGRAVAVFDVLRATTTMAAALAAGVAEIRIFADVASARAAALAYDTAAAAGASGVVESRAGVAGWAGGGRILCGETNCLPPDGFDLGNSPGGFVRDAHAGRVVFMSTTNGTRAILAARGAAARFAAAVVNAGAVARALVAAGRDVTLLCAGTGGRVAMEDAVGCGAVIAALRAAGGSPVLANDPARIADRLFADNRHRLRDLLADAEGGRNVTAVGLPADIDFAARVDALDVVGVVEEREVPTVRAWP